MDQFLGSRPVSADIYDESSSLGGISARYSLIGDNTGSGLAEAPLGAPDADGNLIGDPNGAGVIEPLLGPLADNGGWILTHALLPGSPAIGAGDPDAEAGVDDVPLFDQRGWPFDRISGGRIDLGAFEAQVTLPELLGDYNEDGMVDAADYVVWRDTMGDEVDFYAGADGSGNGVIDEQDYAVWRENFGNSLPPPEEGGGSTAAAAQLATSVPQMVDLPRVNLIQREQLRAKLRDRLASSVDTEPASPVTHDELPLLPSSEPTQITRPTIPRPVSSASRKPETFDARQLDELLLDRLFAPSDDAVHRGESESDLPTDGSASDDLSEPSAIAIDSVFETLGVSRGVLS
jgi:hypothetical protein